MESNIRLRLGLILALFLGAIYTLLPTVLQDDASVALAEKTQSIEVDAPKTAVDLVVDFSVKGPTDRVVEQAKDRLKAVGITVSKVSLNDQGYLEILMIPGTDRADVRAAMTANASASYYPIGQFAPEGVEGDWVQAEVLARFPQNARAELGVLFADNIGALHRLNSVKNALPPTVKPITLKAGSVDLDELAIPLGEAAQLDNDAIAVVSDGVVVAIGIQQVKGSGDLAMSYLKLYPLKGSEAALKTLSLGSTDATLTPYEAPVVASSAADEGAQVQLIESSAPNWWTDYLPNTKMNMGLDLQGGIDLTLQVDLEQAVISRVLRDAAALRSDIEKDFGSGSSDEAEAPSGMAGCNQSNLSASALDEGWAKARVKSDPDLPILRISVPLPLSEVQSYFARRLTNYSYSETITDTQGVEFHVFPLSDEQVSTIEAEAVQQVLETLRRRIDSTGVKEPSIVQKGGGRINIQLPGMVDLQSAVDAIGTTAMLEFLLVDRKLDAHLLADGIEPRPVPQMIAEAKEAMPDDQFNDDQMLDRWLHDNRYLSDDRLLAWEYDEEDETLRRFHMILKIDNNPLTGQDVNDASISFDQAHQPLVLMNFKARGSNKFCEMTSANIGEPFAILLDGVIKSAPSIRSAICGGRAQIEMGGGVDPRKEAKTLVTVLRSGSLNAPVTVGDVRIIGSTLGKDAIQAGKMGMLIGATLVLLFMGLWYKKSGMLANIALVLNVVLVLAILSVVGATLTLPGIAGIALTVGMAVDANIIIYERIREELALGQLARKAVAAGFEKATVAVLDANITTAIAAIVLYSYGTGPIKGFAVTLLIGIITTLITALFVTRTLMDVATRDSSTRLSI